MILNGTEEQYPSLISKLSNILEPFALLAVGTKRMEASVFGAAIVMSKLRKKGDN